MLVFLTDESYWYSEKMLPTMWRISYLETVHIMLTGSLGL